MKISYGLTVCNEHEELKNLIEYLFKRIDSKDEIVVVYDQNRVTPEGLTESHIQKWGWNVNEQGWVNWPDAQKRIYKNTSEIKWLGHQVHGMVEGYKTFATLPFTEEWSIIHNKTIDRQENQNKRYTKIEIGELK